MKSSNSIIADQDTIKLTEGDSSELWLSDADFDHLPPDQGKADENLLTKVKKH